MKLTHLALIMTLVLVGVTGWLAWDQHSDARGARNQLELLQRQRDGGAAPGKVADANDLQARENQILLAQMAARQNAASNAQPPMTPSSRGGSGNPAADALSSKGHVSAAALEATPPALTPRQRLLMSLPAIAKVSESQQQYGFVVITAGANKRLEQGSIFALRRGKAVVGRIKIIEVNPDGSTADLVKDSVPVGVDVQLGDDVVQDLPPES